MTIKRLLLTFYSLLYLAATLISCTTAKPTLEWRDPSYTGGSFENLLIVGIANQETVRRTFENTFVDRLKEDNIKATASFAVMMPPEARPTEESIKKVIHDINFDSVLFTHMVGMEEKEVYHPPTYNMHPYGGMYGYYGHVGGYVYEPGYYSRYQLVRLETILYDAKTEKMVWSMQSETMNPGSEKGLIEAKIKTVIKQLKSQELISGNK